MTKQVFGFLAVVFFALFVILAVISVFGAIKRSSSWIKYSINGAALACLLLTFVSVGYPIWISARLSGWRTSELKYVREVVLASLMYSADNGDRAPLAKNWKEAISPYLGEYKLSVDHPVTSVKDWLAFNSLMSGREFSDLLDPADTVLFAGGTKEKSNYESGVIVGFCDGHVKYINAKSFSWGDPTTLFAAPQENPSSTE